MSTPIVRNEKRKLQGNFFNALAIGSMLGGGIQNFTEGHTLSLIAFVLIGILFHAAALHAVRGMETVSSGGT